MKLLIAILIAYCIYKIVRRTYLKHWEDGLNIEVDFPEGVVREGDIGTLECTITNGKVLPLPVLLVKFAITRTFIFKNEVGSAVTDQYYRNEYFTLKPYERLVRKYPFVCSRRGLFGMKDMDVICKDLFLSEEMYSTREHEARMLVLPRRIQNKEIPDEIHKFMGDIESSIKLQEDPFAFSMIREYQPYDSMHSVNWKSSARMDRLMVNTFNSTLQREIVIIVNLTCNSNLRNEEMQEEIIRIAATMSAELINRKISVALLSNGKDKVSDISVNVAAGADGKHVHTIEYALARIDLTKRMDTVIDIIDNAGKSEVGNTNLDREYILISNERKEKIMDSMTAARERGVHVTHVLPLFKDEAEYAGVPEFIAETGAVKWVINDA